MTGVPVISLILRDPDLRLSAGLMLLQGAFGCSLGPYLSVLAVRQFGLGDRGFAAMMVVATLVSVAASLLAGIRADQTADRRRMSLWACGLMVAGAGLMTLAPGRITFVLTTALILPSATLYGQLFAQARLAARAHDAATRDGIMATVRAIFALPFVVVLPLWALAFERGAEILSVYPVALSLALAMLGLTAWAWPNPAAAAWTDRPSGLSLRQALGELAAPGLALRILALGAATAGGTAYWAIMGLVLTGADGSGLGTAALYAGLVAGLEVPFMLAMAWVLPHVARTRLILIGTAIYTLQLLGIPLLAHSPLLWLCLIPGSIGGAITLTLPIAYLQDALGHRPGTGAALMALMKVTGDVLAAGCFALGTWASGYLLAAALAAIVTLIGGLVLVWADRAAGSLSAKAG